jgi:hypothetical protein
MSTDAQIRAAQRRRAENGKSKIARVPPLRWPTGERWCTGCQSFVPLWYCSDSRCRACKARSRRESAVRSTYGLSPERLAELVELQDGKCAICRKGQNIKALAVDHDHKTGAVRGLLCQRCNREILGAAFDSVSILRSAVRYLECPPAGGAWTPPEMT